MSLDTPIRLSWANLRLPAQASCLGISPGSHPEEFGAFLTTRSQRGAATPGEEGTLKNLATQLAQASGAAIREERFRSGFLSVSELKAPGPQPYENLKGRIANLREMKLFDDPGRSLHTMTAELVREPSNKRVVSLDLGSLDDVEQRCIVAGVALEALWNDARNAWTEALKVHSDKDCTFRKKLPLSPD